MRVRRVADGSDIPSPLEIIAAFNRMEGRETGPLTAGYVDEYGRPITPKWPSALGLSTDRLPAAEQVITPAHSETRPAEAWQPPAPAVPEQWNVAVERVEHVALATGEGLWREHEFVLSERELASVRKLVVGAITRTLGEP